MTDRDKRIASLQSDLDSAVAVLAEKERRIRELEAENMCLVAAARVLRNYAVNQDERIGELEPDAEAYRRLCDIRKKHPGIPCACEFDDDNSDTVLTWCEFHKQYRDFIREYDRAAEQHAMPSWLDDARKALDGE